MATNTLEYRDIVQRVSDAFIKQSFQPLTINNMETHLEDLNILNDKQQSFNIPTGTVVNQLEAMGDYFDNVGYETSFLIMNALRFVFKTNDTTNVEFTVMKWLEIIRSAVGTINTTLRYRQDTTT